jgi:hypothetical protein
MAVFPSRSTLQDKRSCLRVLDACLTELEDAHERNESRISQAVASRLAPHVPGLRPGMLIVDAIERVLRDQERYLKVDGAGRRRAVRATTTAASNTVEPPLNDREARELTDRIRGSASDVCLLVLEAHRRSAPRALGYRSWEHYVRHEFGMSRRRSYELLDQAHVMLAIRDAVPLSGIPHIRPFVAGYIKSHLDDVIGEIRTQLAEVPDGSPELAVKRVVDEERRRFADERRQRFESRSPAGAEARWDGARFWHAIELLASLPPATPGRGTAKQEAQLARVAAWLTTLRDRLEERVA